jgi:exodeoxyribonuclease VIII
MPAPSQSPLGVVRGVPADDYHKGPGLSHSDVKLILRTPFHYRQKTSGDVPARMPNEAMRNGTAVHCAALEPSEFVNRYAWPKFDGASVLVAVEALRERLNDKRTKDWKNFAAEAAEDGLEPLTPMEHDAIWRQATAVRAHPRVADLLARAGDAEACAFWIDPETGVLCKCRPDRWCDADDGIVLLDVKTTSDASADAFSRSVHTFGYHTQADWYCAGWEAASARMVFGMVFAVVESEYPHAVAAYVLDQDALDRAKARNRRALDLFVQCTRSGVWPGYSAEVETIGLPRWAAD